MTEGRHAQIERLFHKAAELPPADQRAFLEAECDDAEVRGQVEQLLEHDQKEGGGLTDQFVDRFLPTQDLRQSAPGRGAVPLEGPPVGTSTGAIDHGRFLPGTVLSERYRIVGMLGKGGMGEVYRADDLELGQSVALKFLPKQLAADPRALERFRGEVRLARQVSHPNVCRVYDIGQIDGQWFLSMEYVDGEDLGQLLTRIGRFNAERATELARQLCMGLHAAHEKRVLHRDLKPANIMIDARGKLLITDFGLAEIAADVRKDDIRSGTPAYMSPEQLAGREVTERSDLYSLGIILHEIYTGKPVWEAGTMAELFEKRKSSPSPTPSSHVSDLDPSVERTIQRCLEQDPAKRPSTALDVTASLPGGDPLSAALAAGQLPSPEIVAASGDSGGLQPATAVGLLAGLVIALFAIAWLAQTTYFINRVEVVKEPAVLADTARRIIQKDLGYDTESADSAFDFSPGSFLDDRELRFWYRQRQNENLNHFHFFREFDESVAFGRTTFQLPAWEAAGEMGLIMNSEGRLRLFRAIPPIKTTTREEEASPLPWSQWFTPETTGYVLDPGDAASVTQRSLDSNVLTLDPSQTRTTPDASDVVRVWRGRAGDEDVVAVTAALHGKPIYYEVFRGPEIKVEPDKQQTRFGMQIPAASRVHPGGKTFRGFINLLFVAATVLACFHLRTGRADISGSFRAALMVLCLAGLCAVTLSHRFSIGQAIFPLIAQALLYAALTWVLYIAIEPLVRRYWPQSLVAWTRLIDGRWSDPLVGRGVLIGMLAAVLGLLHSYCVGYVVSQNYPGSLRLHPHDPLSLSGSQELVGMIMFAIFNSVFGIALLLLMLLGVRFVVRRDLLTIVLGVLLFTPGVMAATNSPVDQFAMWYISAVAAAIMLGSLVRFGFLTGVVFMITTQLINHVPLTLDSGRWYYERGMFVIILLVCVAALACYMAVGGRASIPKQRI